MMNAPQAVGIEPNHTPNKSSLTSNTKSRRPVVSRMEWLGLSHAERIERYASINQTPPLHPALVSSREGQGEHAAPSLSATSPENVEHDRFDTIDEGPDFEVRAARVRSVLHEHIRKEALEKRHSGERVNRASVDRGILRSGTLLKMATWRFSVSSLVAQGRAMTRSLSQSLIAPQHRLAADENASQRGPQKVRIGSVKQRPVISSKTLSDETPGLAGQSTLKEAFMDHSPNRNMPIRKTLQELPLNHRQPDRNALVSKAKEKASDLRNKVRRTIQVWRGDKV